MSEPGWKAELRADLEHWAQTEDEAADLELTLVPHIEAAYQRGLMAGRSQSGYATRRKPRKEEPCRTDTAGAAGSIPASHTEAADEPPEGSAP